MKTINLSKGILPRTNWPLALLPYIIPIVKRLFSPEKGIKVTAKSVIDIIEKAKESGVKEMNIKVEQNVGLSLKDLNIDNAKIDFVLGNRGVMDIHVKYK